MDPQKEEMVNTLGYDPNDTNTDPTTLSGIDNVAARAVLSYRHCDGSNQQNGYADTSGYMPNQIVNPVHWQPLRVNKKVQKFLTPHWGTVTPFSLASGSQFRPAGPVMDAKSSAYKSQVDTIIQYSAALCDPTSGDTKKTVADYWANGPHSETPPGHWMLFSQFVSAQFVSHQNKHDITADIKMFFALSNAVFDAGIAAWDAKRAFDYVRPITAVAQPISLQIVVAVVSYIWVHSTCSLLLSPSCLVRKRELSASHQHVICVWLNTLHREQRQTQVTHFVKHPMQCCLVCEWTEEHGFASVPLDDGQPIEPGRPVTIKMPLDDDAVHFLLQRLVCHHSSSSRLKHPCFSSRQRLRDPQVDLSSPGRARLPAGIRRSFYFRRGCRPRWPARPRLRRRQAGGYSFLLSRSSSPFRATSIRYQNRQACGRTRRGLPQAPPVGGFTSVRLELRTEV
jgi:hypothetical protein